MPGRPPQYAMANDTGKTMVEDIMDLDQEELEPRDQPRLQKFLRNHTSARNVGVMGHDPLENLQPIQPMMHDPYTSQTYPSGPPLNPSQIHPQEESYEPDDKQMMRTVINRIFDKTSDFAEALDSNEHPMHNVAKSFLQKEIGCVDKTVYITIIVILIFAVACLLWKCLSDK